MPLRVYQRLCYLCYQDGEYVPAVAETKTRINVIYDVCEKHKEIVEKQEGFKTIKLEEDEVVMEEKV